MKNLAAGNFRMMNNPELETLMARKFISRYGKHRRMLSFFYRDAAELVMQLKQMKVHIRKNTSSISVSDSMMIP